MEFLYVAECIKAHHYQEGYHEADESLSCGPSKKHLKAHNQQFVKVICHLSLAICHYLLFTDWGLLDVFIRPESYYHVSAHTDFICIYF